MAKCQIEEEKNIPNPNGIFDHKCSMKHTIEKNEEYDERVGTQAKRVCVWVGARTFLSEAGKEVVESFIFRRENMFQSWSRGI